MNAEKIKDALAVAVVRTLIILLTIGVLAVVILLLVRYGWSALVFFGLTAVLYLLVEAVMRVDARALHIWKKNT